MGGTWNRTTTKHFSSSPSKYRHAPRSINYLCEGANHEEDAAKKPWPRCARNSPLSLRQDLSWYKSILKGDGVPLKCDWEYVLTTPLQTLFERSLMQENSGQPFFSASNKHGA